MVNLLALKYAPLNLIDLAMGMSHKTGDLDSFDPRRLVDLQ